MNYKQKNNRYFYKYKQKAVDNMYNRHKSGKNKKISLVNK